MADQDSKNAADEHKKGYLVAPKESMEDLLSTYKDMHTDKYESRIMDHRVGVREHIRNAFKTDLYTHGTDEQMKDGTHPVSYKNLTIKGKDASPEEKRMAVRSVLNKIAINYLAQEHKQSVERFLGFYKDNPEGLHEKIEEHLNEKLARKVGGDIDSLVDYIVDLNHIPGAMDEDSLLKELFDDYAHDVNPYETGREKHKGKIFQRVNKNADDLKLAKKHFDQYYKDHGVELTFLPSSIGAALDTKTTAGKFYNPGWYDNYKLSGKEKHLKPANDNAKEKKKAA